MRAGSHPNRHPLRPNQRRIHPRHLRPNPKVLQANQRNRSQFPSRRRAAAAARVGGEPLKVKEDEAMRLLQDCDRQTVGVHQVILRRAGKLGHFWRGKDKIFLYENIEIA